MNLLPILPAPDDNPRFLANPNCEHALSQTIEFYKRVGYSPPWVGYFAEKDHDVVGMGGFVGKPVDNTVEIAYGVFPQFQQRGIGGEICRQLTRLALQTDPALTVIAHTLPEENFSTRILRKNGFMQTGTTQDPDEGEVWEWTYQDNS